MWCVSRERERKKKRKRKRKRKRKTEMRVGGEKGREIESGGQQRNNRSLTKFSATTFANWSLREALLLPPRVEQVSPPRQSQGCKRRTLVYPAQAFPPAGILHYVFLFTRARRRGSTGGARRVHCLLVSKNPNPERGTKGHWKVPSACWK